MRSLANKKLLLIFKIGCAVVLAALTIFLIAESCVPSKQSAAQSTAVGNVVKAGIDSATKQVFTEPNAIAFSNPEDTAITLFAGATLKLQVEFLPANASYKGRTYASSDNAVVSVSKDGLLTAKGVGTATVTVTSSRINSLTDSFSVTVAEVPLEGLTFKDEAVSLRVGETAFASIVTAPSGAALPTNGVFQSLSPEIATVDNGIIKAIQVGTAILTYSAGGLQTTCTVTVTEGAPFVPTAYLTIGETISLNGENVDFTQSSVTVGNRFKLSVTAFGEGGVRATEQSFFFTVNDNSLAKSVGNGEFIAKGCGDLTVTVRAYSDTYGSYSENFDIHISNYFDKLIIGNIGNLTIGDSVQTEVDYCGATYRVLTYATDNDKVIEVTSDGVVNALAEGEATLTITLDDGDSTPHVYTQKIKVERQSLISDLQRFYLYIRKGLGHFAAFACLGIATAVTLLLLLKKYRFSLPLISVFGFTVAALTELCQKFTEGRYGCWEDVGIDCAGYYIAAVAVVAVFLIVKAVKIRKSKLTQKAAALGFAEDTIITSATDSNTNESNAAEGNATDSALSDTSPTASALHDSALSDTLPDSTQTEGKVIDTKANESNVTDSTVSDSDLSDSATTTAPEESLGNPQADE